MPRFDPLRAFRLLRERGAPSRLAQHLERAAVLADLLPGCGRVAGPERIAFAQPQRIDAQAIGDHVHVRFDGKLRLRRAEAAEGAVRRRIGHRRAAAGANVIAAIRAARVNHAARQHDAAQRRVGAAVEHDVDLHRREPAVLLHAGAMTHDRGMTLRRRQHVLDAVVDQLGRAARLHRHQRGVAGNHRRILLFPAEAAARFGLDDPDLLRRETEQHGQRAMDVVGTLQRPVQRDAAIFRNRDDAVRLDVELLLVTGAVLALDDQIRLGHSLVEPPLLDGDGLE